MQLVYLSPVPWASFAQRPHKFVEWFHQRTGRCVLWIDPYPTRLPRWTDFGRLGAAPEALPASLPPWLAVFKPRALPLEPLPGSAWLNAWAWGRLLRELRQQLQGQDAIVVVGKPSQLALRVLRALRPPHAVYDAMDDFPAFHSGLSRRAMAHHEARLVDAVDSVWASSSVLARRWGARARDLRFVPNALDGALLPPPGRRDGEAGARVFGYVGTIGPWFDWAWVRRLAQLHPGDTVRLIGPQFHPAPFALPPNVELLPPCSHEEALRAMHGFDVGIIPFRRNELTASVDPIKYYEYRALGLAVLSTDFGEMQMRGNEPGVFLCRTHEDLPAAAAVALRYEATAAGIAAFVRGNTWARRFDAAGLLPIEAQRQPGTCYAGAPGRASA